MFMKFEAANSINAPFPCDQCGWPCFSSHELEIHKQTLRCASSASPLSSRGDSEQVAALKAQIETQGAQIKQLVDVFSAVVASNQKKKPGPKPKGADAA